MVFYFTPRRAEEGYVIYMGLDKHENEKLIRWALPVDLWFHVDSLSSAHVYVRCPEGITMDNLPEDVLEDASQLVKANSIQGCKINNVCIVYTPANNLKKTASMEVGQVSFKDEKAIRKTVVDRKNNEIINRLNRSKKELFPDLEAEREAWEREQRGKAKAEAVAQRLKEKEEREANKREKELRSYDHVMREEDMVTVKEMREKYETPEAYEEDFM